MTVIAINVFKVNFLKKYCRLSKNSGEEKKMFLYKILSRIKFYSAETLLVRTKKIKTIWMDSENNADINIQNIIKCTYFLYLNEEVSNEKMMYLTPVLENYSEI